MSLATEVANLTTKVVGLVDLVKGQWNVWDARVNSYIANIRNSIKKEMAKRIYVDCIYGSDTNDGLSSDKPLKSLGRLFDLYVITGGRYEVILSSGKHIMDRRLSISSISIIFKGSNDLENPTFVESVETLSNPDASGGFSLKQNSFIQFDECVLVTSDNEVTNHVNCFFDITFADAGIVIDNYETKDLEEHIILNNNALVQVYGGLGSASICFRNSKANAVLDTSLLIKNYGTSSLNFSGFSEINGKSISDLIVGIIRDTNGVPQNTISNKIL